MHEEMTNRKLDEREEKNMDQSSEMLFTMAALR